MRTACGELLVSRFFRHFSLHSEKTWRGRSLLFTQLAPWKGLLNMKYEESGEVRGRELGRKEGREPSERGGGGGGGPSKKGS